MTNKINWCVHDHVALCRKQTCTVTVIYCTEHPRFLNAPQEWSIRRNIAVNFKSITLWLSEYENVLKISFIFVLREYTNVTYGHRHRDKQHATAWAALMYSIAWGNKSHYTTYFLKRVEVIKHRLSTAAEYLFFDDTPHLSTALYFLIFYLHMSPYNESTVCVFWRSLL